MVTYKVKKDNEQIVFVVSSDGWCIPPDETNTQYQEYLKWVAEGNEAEEWVSE